MKRGVLLRFVLFIALGAAVSACNDSDEPTPTAKPIIEGNAVQIFLREAHKVGWFNDGDPIELESEPYEFAGALAEAQKLGLALYPTSGESPPYTNGLPGWLITARGDFFDVADGQLPTPETARRPAVAAAFVDREGRLTYGMRFTDVVPSPTTAG